MNASSIKLHRKPARAAERVRTRVARDGGMRPGGARNVSDRWPTPKIFGEWAFAGNSQALDKFLAKVASSFYICSNVPAPAEIAEPTADLLNRGASSLTAKRSRPEMAPQRLEKIESAPGNGMGSEASDPQDLVRGRKADRARLRLTTQE